MNSSSNRVKDELLDYEGDALSLDGVPFSGIGYSEYPSGNLKEEFNYIEGFPCGLCQQWYENGQLKFEYLAIKGQAPNQYSEWFENGILKIRKESDCGIEVEYSEWDKEGKLVVERKLAEDSPMRKVIERMKKAKS